MKLKITLRWRMTLLTIGVLLTSSIALVGFNNLNIGTIMPQVQNNIIAVGFSVPNQETLPENLNAATGITGEVGYFGSVEGEAFVQEEIYQATMDMYGGSIIVLIIINLLGGILAYFIAGSALKPIKQLNNNIKKVNANNLLSISSTDGPRDEIKELIISFNSMLAKLENAFSSQKRFNASVAHELKTPLAVMKANMEVLHDQETVSIEEYNQTFAIVEQSINKMNAMVEALLDSVQEENSPLNDEVKIDELILDVAEDLGKVAEKNQVQIIKEIQDVPTIVGNEVLLYRAIYNIVENAIKYNRPEGTVTITCRKQRNDILIRVADTGTGMIDSEMENIFKPFYRINKEEKEGLGLGLALTKSVISMHSGQMKVKSEPGQGSDFEILLPIVAID